MFLKTLLRILKAARYDFRNLFYPFRYPHYFLKGIYLFNGNRIRKHPTARIFLEGGTIQFGTFWPLWKRPGGILLHAGAVLRITGNVVIGDGVLISVHPGAHLEIGPETFINPDSRIIAQEYIRIGAGCAVAWEVQIMDGDRHFILDAEGNRKKNTSPIDIGDRAWIGARSILLKGARVGDGAVIGAGSVVSGEVPSETVFAGNPARQVRESVHWEK